MLEGVRFIAEAEPDETRKVTQTNLPAKYQKNSTCSVRNNATRLRCRRNDGQLKPSIAFYLPAAQS